MTGMKVDEWLSALRTERSWEQIGARKLPFTTIALKSVLPACRSSCPHLSQLHFGRVWRT